MRAAIGLGALLVMVACASSSEAPICPSVASSCSADCTEMTASQLDEARMCAVRPVVVGCRPKSSFRTTDAPCVVRTSDGAVFRAIGGSGFMQAGWRPCTRDEDDRLLAAYGYCP